MTPILDRTTWTRIRFGDVVSNVNETIRDPLSAGIDRVIAMEHLEPSDLKITRWGSIEDGTTFTRRVRPGQTLFGKRRAYQRKAAYAEFDAICSGDILTFQANPSKLLPELLPFLVQSDGFYEHALGTSAGSLSPRTNWKDLANYEFDLPPLDHQHRIADLLWALEYRRKALSSLILAVRHARSVHLNQRLRQSNNLVEIGKIVHMLRDGPFGSKIKTEHYDSSPGVRVLRLKDVQPGRISDTDIAWLKSAHVVEELSAYRVRAQELVVAGLGDENNPVGRAALVGGAQGAVHKADIFRIQVDESSVRAGFLAEFLNSDTARPLLLAQAQGTTRLRINTTNLRKVVLPLLPLAEQDRVLNDLAAFDRVDEALHSEFSSVVEIAGSVLREVAE